MSLSSRRAWIEINAVKYINSGICVALLTESVDWNIIIDAINTMKLKVALLTESVDWNHLLMISILKSKLSLSSRRAWIEILPFVQFHWNANVALLTESVDWNNVVSTLEWLKHLSLSSRRAWIEIFDKSAKNKIEKVALLTESVDWNKAGGTVSCKSSSRSPHGERGLKYN